MNNNDRTLLYRRIALCTWIALAGAACAQDEPSIPDCDGDCPALLMEISTEALGLAQPAADAIPVRVGMFVSISPGEPASVWTIEDAAAYIGAIVRDTDVILAQCSLYVEVEVANIITLPDGLLDIQGNEPGSIGGHPPAGTENPELFNYEQNEGLTDEVRKVFEFAKAFTSDNAIAAITVRDIEYYSEGSFENQGAGGLSFPPNEYHRAKDYPARNSVLLVPEYGEPASLPGPIESITLAHELGHMLLNSGTHVTDPQNLMSGYGSTLIGEQCEVMLANLTRLFGDDAVADPGPPSQN